MDAYTYSDECPDIKTIEKLLRDNTYNILNEVRRPIVRNYQFQLQQYNLGTGPYMELHTLTDPDLRRVIFTEDFPERKYYAIIAASFKKESKTVAEERYMILFEDRIKIVTYDRSKNPSLTADEDLLFICGDRLPIFAFKYFEYSYYMERLNKDNYRKKPKYSLLDMPQVYLWKYSEYETRNYDIETSHFEKLAETIEKFTDQLDGFQSHSAPIIDAYRKELQKQELITENIKKELDMKVNDQALLKENMVKEHSLAMEKQKLITENMEKDREILIKTQLELNTKIREVESTRMELLKDREIFKNEQKISTENLKKDRENLDKKQIELDAKLQEVEIARAEITKMCNILTKK